MSKRKPTNQETEEQQTEKLPFYNKYNRHLLITRGESTDLPSQTSQGEAISMAEMIRKHTRGDIPPLARQAFMGDDPDINKPLRHARDLTDLPTDTLGERKRALASAIAETSRSEANNPRGAEGKITMAEAESDKEVAERTHEVRKAEA